MTGGNVSGTDLSRTLREELGVQLPASEVERLLSLHPRHVVEHKGVFRLTEAASAEFAVKLEDAERLERQAGELFTATAEECCAEMVGDTTWQRFNEILLLPMIRELGARTYDFINGEGFNFDASDHLDRFLAEYSPNVRTSAQATIARFLDPKNKVARAYVLRQLSASFLTSAANLDDAKLKELRVVAEKEAEFHVFTDTNFLFSLFTLHDNPSNEAARRLSELTEELQGVIDFRLFALPISLAETKNAVAGTVDSLRGIVLTQNYLDALVNERNLSSLALTFLDQAGRPGGTREAEEFFRPYQDSLVDVLREQHVDLFNQKTDEYNTRDDVVDDINTQLEWEQRKFGERAKTYEKLKHDLVLWHFVKDKRSAFVESPLAAKYWIVTVDYRLLGFDSYKQRRRQQLSVCLHPTVLVQMLQFWVPRTVQLEEALLSSIRLPFLFQEFDPATERVTIKILKALSRIEGSSSLSSDTIRRMMIDDELRRRMRSEEDVEKQIQLVRDEFVEQEARLRRENEHLKRRLEETSGKRTESEEETAKLQAELAQERESKERMADELRTITQETTQTQQDLATERVFRENVRFYSRRVPISLIAAGAVGFAVTFLLSAFTKVVTWQAIVVGCAIGLLLMVEILTAGAEGKSKLAGAVLWRGVTRLRWLLRWLVGAAVTGVIGTVTYVWVQTW
jgi:regulator of replication initiation timing